MKLRGCIPILCTPFRDDGSLDLASLLREIEWVIAEGANGVAALAIASEGYKLTEAEREAVTATTVETVDRRVPVVISADGAGTEIAIDRAKRAAAAGADGVMVLPPYFVKPDPHSLFDYYQRIGDAVEIPVIVQDAPQLTGVGMNPAFWVKLVDSAPNVRYVKAEGTPQGTTLSETIRQSNGRIDVFCGWGGLGLLDALERGAAGSMPAMNFTRLFASVQNLYEAGSIDPASNLFHRALPYILWSMQSVDFSVKTAKEELQQLGVIESSCQRQPAAALDEISLAQLDRWIAARKSA